MNITYKPEKIESGLWMIRRYIGGEIDIFVAHKPFENQFAAQQFCRLLMRNIRTKK